MSPSDTSKLNASARTQLVLPSAEAVRSAMVEPVQAAAFWSAIGLPLVYAPMLVTGGLQKHPVALGLLLLLNAVAFVVGHEHNQPDGGTRHD